MVEIVGTGVVSGGDRGGVAVGFRFGVRAKSWRDQGVVVSILGR